MANGTGGRSRPDMHQGAMSDDKAKTIVGINSICKFLIIICGELPERLNGAVSKTVVGLHLPRVRIPDSPPIINRLYEVKRFKNKIWLFGEKHIYFGLGGTSKRSHKNFNYMKTIYRFLITNYKLQITNYK